MANLRALIANAFDDSTDVAVSPAAVAAMPVTNLQSTVRGDLWRSTSIAPQVFTGTWGGNVRVISAFGVWPSAQQSSLIGSSWRLQLFQDAAATVSVLDQTYAFFTPTGDPWGTFAWGAAPWGVEKGDLTARLAPMVKYFAPVNASAFRITVSDLGNVDTPYFEARRIWLADYLDAPYKPKRAAPAWVTSAQTRRSSGGSARRFAGAIWRELQLDTVLLAEADRAKWCDLLAVAAPAAEIVLSVFPQDAYPRRERDFTAMGSIEGSPPIPMENVSLHTLQLKIVES